MKTPPLAVRFGTAKNGWLPVSVSTIENQVEFAASYTPKDIVLSLIEALLSIATSRTGTSYTITLFLEPVEQEIRFTWSGPEDDLLCLEIVEFPDRYRENVSGKIQLAFQDKRSAILIPFWRALRDLGSRAEHESFETQWRSPFPYTELAQFTAVIKAIQHGSAAV